MVNNGETQPYVRYTAPCSSSSSSTRACSEEGSGRWLGTVSRTDGAAMPLLL
jgi:hypothetical protein